MNIAILHRYPPGQLIETNPAFPAFIVNLLRRGHRVYLLTLEGKQGTLPNTVRHIVLPFQVLRAKNIDKFVKSILFALLAPCVIAYLAPRERIDLIYCDDSFPFYGFFTKILVGKRRVAQRMGDLQSGYALLKQSWLKTLLFSVVNALERWMWRKLDGIVAISQVFQEYFLEYGFSKEKVPVVRECIDVNHFRARKSTMRNHLGVGRSPLLMFHGTLVPMKGTSALIRAFQKVLKVFPEAHLAIIGDGPELLHLRTLAAQLHVSQGLIFTGWVSYENMPTYLAAADIGVIMRSGNFANHFVLTSALLQYWALKKPVIVPRLRTMETTIRDRHTGVFFTPDDADDLAEKIIYLLSHRNTWKQLGAHGQRVAKRYFSAEVIGRSLADALLGLPS